MKAKYILQILPLLFMFSIVGCTKDDVPSTDEPKEYNISLKFSGEITATDTPLTRGEDANDLIGLQIYKDGKAWKYYISRSIENFENYKITLHSDKTYKFVATMVKNGMDVIGQLQYNGQPLGYPFYNIPLPSSQSDIEGYYNNDYNDDQGEYFKKGKSTLKSGKDYNYPAADRFYGEVENYTPTENGVVAIDLKRTAFGLKYEVSGITDGTVSVTISNASRTFFSNTAITADYQSEEEIFTFSDVYSAWKYADNYTESITVQASWLRGVGINQDLGSKTVQIKRNAMNIIRIKLGAVDYDGNIGIEVEEETDFEEEHVTGTLE